MKLIHIFQVKLCNSFMRFYFHTVDHSRVVLSVPDENGSDYINASYIDVSVILLNIIE